MDVAYYVVTLLAQTTHCVLFFSLSAIVLGLPVGGAQFPDAARKNPMHIVQLLGEPFVLPFPIVVILWVGVVQNDGYPTVLPSRQFFPLQRIT